MEQLKPIKRSKELVPLSREHHDGLLLCWKIRTGIANGTAAERIAAYIIHFYKTDLTPHFAKEEKYLFTLLPPADANRIKAEEQHAVLRSLVNVLIGNAEEVLTVINDFNKLLEQHIRFEERELFPIIEKQTTSELLTEAGEMINAHADRSCNVWEDEFWTKK